MLSITLAIFFRLFQDVHAIRNETPLADDLLLFQKRGFPGTCHETNTYNERRRIFMKPPIAKRIPHPHELHGDVREDDFYWLKDRNNPEVIHYLEEENQYYR